MAETTSQLYPIALTNGVSLGRGYLFPWQIADGGVVKETCAKTVTIFLQFHLLTVGVQKLHMQFYAISTN